MNNTSLAKQKKMVKTIPKKSFQADSDPSEITNLPRNAKGESTTVPFTKVTFWPDLSKFEGSSEMDASGKPTGMNADILALFRRRAYDVAGSTRSDCKVGGENAN
jgi:hypothetical protein